MNRSSWVAFSLVGVFALAALFLPACNTQDPPVAPGLIANSKPCGTFGHNSIEASSTGSNDLWFDPFVAGSNMTLYTLSVYTVSTSPITFEAGVYSNSVSKPGSLLSETGTVTSGPATQWNTVSLQHDVPLSSGVTYWLAYQSTTFRYAAASTAYAFQSEGVYGSLPENFSGTLINNGFVFSIYGTACP